MVKQIVNGSAGIPRDGRELEYATELWLDDPGAFFLHPEGPLSETTPEEWKAKQHAKAEELEKARSPLPIPRPGLYSGMENQYASLSNQYASLRNVQRAYSDLAPFPPYIDPFRLIR